MASMGDFGIDLGVEIDDGSGGDAAGGAAGGAPRASDSPHADRVRADSAHAPLIRLWRICKAAHVATTLEGLGGLHVSGRWHHRGRPIVYTSTTPSLAALEVLVHLDPADAPVDLRLVELELPLDVSLEEIDPGRLIRGEIAEATAALAEQRTLDATAWTNHPAPDALPTFGTQWLDTLRCLALIVPSAVMPLERNVLLNPRHPEMARVRLIRDLPFAFDARVVRGSGSV